MSKIPGFLERLQKTTSLEEIQNLVTGFRDDQDVEHAIYHVVGDTGKEYGALTYDPEWVGHYISNKYYLIDPTVSKALQSFGPFDWRSLDWSHRDARKLIGEAVSEGVGKQGISVPIRGTNGQFAMFSVTSFQTDTSWDRFTTEMNADLILAGYYIHQRAAQLMGHDDDFKPADLSPRERGVLTMLALGRSRGQAAESLKISEHTLRTYIDTARLKLGALNSTHAVALAMTQGLIIP